MRFTRIQLIFLSLLAISFLFLSHNKSYAGFDDDDSVLPLAETDTDNYQLYYFFDLRERVSFVQVTNVGSAATLHVQIFDVSNLCNENNFNDAYTANDTHVYDMRDIQSNDGADSGVELPDDAYGIVVVTVIQGIGQPADTSGSIIGNFRVIDNSGYEYRTNSQSPSIIFSVEDGRVYTFNFNRVSDINFSDVVGITLNNIRANEVTTAGSSITFNNNEVEFSCSDTTFSCTADTFEYGINEAIPHSRDKAITCPSNNIDEGFVRLEIISEESIEAFAGYIGINTGNNSRGSMDSFHQQRGTLSCEERGFCRVFVTNQRPEVGIDFTGLTSADAICQSTAILAGFPGRFLAWLSDNNQSPNSRFNRATVPYINTLDQQIASSYIDLITSMSIDDFIFDENGNSIDGNGAWTGTDADGEAVVGQNCDNWTNQAGTSPVLGAPGDQTDSRWSNFALGGCTVGNLICFEQ